MRTTTAFLLHTRTPLVGPALPLVIGGATLLFMLGLGAVLGFFLGPEMDEVHAGMIWNGAVWSFLGPLLFAGQAAMTQYFPLALGLGLTRREFAVGTTLYLGATAVGAAAIVGVMQAIERATVGFGLRIRMFDVVWVGLGPVWQTLVQTFLIVLAWTFAGAAFATVFVRFGRTALWLVIGGLGAVGIVASALVLLSGVDAVALVADVPWGTWMLVLAAAAAVSWLAWGLLIRRTPVR